MEYAVEDGRARAILNDVAYLADQFNIHFHQGDRGERRSLHGVVRCGYVTNDVLFLVIGGRPALTAGLLLLRKAHPELTNIFLNASAEAPQS